MSHSTQPIISLPNFHTYFSKSVLGYYYQSNHNRDWRVRTVGKMFALHMAKSGSTPGIPNVSRNSPGVIRVCRARSNPDDFWVWPKNKQAERVLITTSGWGYPSQMVFCLNELLITPNPFLHCCYWGFFFVLIFGLEEEGISDYTYSLLMTLCPGITLMMLRNYMLCQEPFSCMQGMCFNPYAIFPALNSFRFC